MSTRLIEQLSRRFGSCRVLVVVATPLEAAPIRSGLGASGEILISGVGKAAAAAAVVGRLAKGDIGAVLNTGLAGALPGGGLSIGQVVAASGHCLADEGVRTPERFVAMSELGFGPPGASGMTFSADPGMLDAVCEFADVTGVIATVSTCSGTDELAREVAGRAGAIAEAMEGAAVALACRSMGVAMGELRAISNTTGLRSAQRWDVPGALAALSRRFGLAD